MLNLTDANFEQEISKFVKPVLVDFWAEWCPSCLVLGPILEKIENDYCDKLIVAKVNLDTAPIIAQKYKIDRIPAVILFKNSKPVTGFVGARPETIIRELLDKMLDHEEKKEDGGNDIIKLIKSCQQYAQENELKLNPDKEIVKRLATGLLANKRKYGARYCPCRRVTESLKEDKGKICPCQWHMEEIERDGYCLCRLFFKK